MADQFEQRCSWLFQEDYQELYEEDGVGIIRRAWADKDAPMHTKHRCLPRPSVPPMNDGVRMTYLDDGAVGQCNLQRASRKALTVTDIVVDLARWPMECDLIFSVPSWDWKGNKKSKATKLQVPQILVQAASEKTVRQPVDGNIGFSVPG